MGFRYFQPMMTTQPVVLAALMAFCLSPAWAQQPQPGPNNQEEQPAQGENENISDEADERRFWQASLPGGGHYMVALDRISSVSMQQYLLDGNLVVNEVTVDTNGRALARFYYLEPLAESMKRNEVTRVVDRGRELLDRAGERLGTDAHNMVQKNYPATTHTGMLEFRILDLRDLDALYGSLRRAWESGRGRRFTIK
jgi:hypothetical protein